MLFVTAVFSQMGRKTGGRCALDVPETHAMKHLSLPQIVAAIAVLVVVLDLFPGGGGLLVELAQALMPVALVARQKNQVGARSSVG
jgi:hypothetical protein